MARPAREDGNTQWINRSDSPDGRVDNRPTNNRFVAARSTEESLDENPDRVLLNIMRDEYPDDPLYSRGRLTPASQAQQAREGFTISDEVKKGMLIAERNEKNVVMLNSTKEKFASYELKKSYPTIDEDELDDLIDEEFEDPDDDGSPDVVEPGVSGLFLVNQEKDREDFHHLYITRGPQNLLNDELGEVDFEDIFCVFYIHNGKARPIPNYKTLEVMLVEKGLKYDVITEATAEQIKEFDLLLDGKDSTEDYDKAENPTPGEGDDDEESTPADEYMDRALADRATEWDYHVRYRSGYRQMFPFRRDPGDYIKPATLRMEGGRLPDLNDPIEEDEPTAAVAGATAQRADNDELASQQPGQDDEEGAQLSQAERRQRRRERRRRRR